MMSTTRVRYVNRRRQFERWSLLAVAGLVVLLAGGCSGKIIDLQVVNRTEQRQSVELDGWGVYNEVIGRPAPGETARYTLRVAGCRLPTEYTLDAGERHGAFTVSAFTPETLRYALTSEGFVQMDE